ncbi:MAG TPA: SDR family NAD(P)-dependent oxidoreductase, partial [Methanomassiliicoccales archaeon]|nr:SDR family NAD(P)-dependent oxidoreductase [Methanomassiliicoccales archaeon]
MHLKDQVAVITGASGALGTVVVMDALAHGMKVVSTYQDEGRQQKFLSKVGDLGTNLTSLKVDVTSEDQVRRLFEQAFQTHGRLDVLLNIVGGYRGGHEVQDTPLEEWEGLMRLNLLSAFLCCREALRYMVPRNHGRIVNVSARPAIERRYRAKGAAYAVSKAGVLVLTEAIAEEVKKLDININAVLPSTIDTQENRDKMPQSDFSRWVPP